MSQGWLVSNYSLSIYRGLLCTRHSSRHLHFILSAILWNRYYYYTPLPGGS